MGIGSDVRADGESERGFTSSAMEPSTQHLALSIEHPASRQQVSSPAGNRPLGARSKIQDDPKRARPNVQLSSIERADSNEEGAYGVHMSL